MTLVSQTVQDLRQGIGSLQGVHYASDALRTRDPGKRVGLYNFHSMYLGSYNCEVALQTKEQTRSFDSWQQSLDIMDTARYSGSRCTNCAETFVHRAGFLPNKIDPSAAYSIYDHLPPTTALLALANKTGPLIKLHFCPITKRGKWCALLSISAVRYQPHTHTPRPH